MANRERFLSKVIVRNLPLSLDEAAFKQIIGESTCASIDLFYYVQGKAKYVQICSLSSFPHVSDLKFQGEIN